MDKFLYRSTLKEEMDSPSFSDRDIHDSFDFIRKVNRFLGGSRTTLRHLQDFSRTWNHEELITILDIGTGCADIPLQILRWAKKKNFRVRIFALDSNFRTLRHAHQFLHIHPEIHPVRNGVSNGVQLITADALSLPFKEQSIDYILSAMFFHHLTDDQIINLLRNANQIAKRGIIINDLARHRRAYLWISFLTRFISNPHVRADAQLSVLRGFKRHELQNYIVNADIDYLNIYRHFAHRFALAGEKIKRTYPKVSDRGNI